MWNKGGVGPSRSGPSCCCSYSPQRPYTIAPGHMRLPLCFDHDLWKKSTSRSLKPLCFGLSLLEQPILHFSSVQSLSRVRLFATPWITARQASLSITNSWSLLKLMSIESVMPSSHLILCRPLLLLPSIFPSIRVFSSKSTLRMRWPKYWSFSFSISPSNSLNMMASTSGF